MLKTIQNYGTNHWESFLGSVDEKTNREIYGNYRWLYRAYGYIFLLTDNGQDEWRNYVRRAYIEAGRPEKNWIPDIETFLRKNKDTAKQLEEERFDGLVRLVEPGRQQIPVDDNRGLVDFRVKTKWENLNWRNFCGSYGMRKGKAEVVWFGSFLMPENIRDMWGRYVQIWHEKSLGKIVLKPRFTDFMETLPDNLKSQIEILWQN